MQGRLLGAALAAAVLLGFATTARAAGPAPDGPGALAHFDLARKDCVGTARNTGSKVWFTVAGGVLSDVYYPTNDNTNNETLQYVVTDGRSFTDLQTRNMTYTVTQPDDRALTCRVTATGRDGRYKLVTDYLTDPRRPTVLMHTRFVALKGRLSDYAVYVRFDSTLNGNGGGGAGNAGADSGTVAASHHHTALVGSDPVTATQAANRDYAQPVYSALDTDTGLLEASNGFVGADSDGLKQLDTARRLTATYRDATKGNLVQTGRIRLGHRGDFTLALGFGADQAGALKAAHKSLRQSVRTTAADYAHGWHVYNRRLKQPRRPQGVSSSDWASLLDEYHLSADYVKAAEDKTFAGATAAALASPWGQAVSAGDPNNTYFGSYREVFARDLYEAWTSLWLAGDERTARDMTRFLFERQQLPDGSMPRNSLPNGKPAPDSFGNQLDEDSYPLMMALAVGLTSRSYYTAHIRPAADFVASHGPIGGNERWEEQAGYSPSTMSAEIAGLLAGARIADINGDAASAAVWRGTADEFQRNLKAWTLTHTGHSGANPYFIRLSKTGDPDAAITYNVGNGGPTLDQRDVIDQGFLEYARLGVLPAGDADIVRSLAVVDATIRHDTASGQGFLRYNGDGYGDRSSDGRPWENSGGDTENHKGTGHVWPVLAGERGQYEVDRGQTSSAIARLKAMRDMASGVGLIPEQAWDAPDVAPDRFGTDPGQASIGFVNGKPAGSAAALTWSAGQFVRLLLDAGAGRVLDRPRYTVDRYVEHGPPGRTALTVTSPADRSPALDSVVVAGTSAPSNSIVVDGVNQDDHAAVARTVTAGPDGSWSVTLPVTPGTTVIGVVATSRSGATAWARRTVVWDKAPGTLVFSASDPDGDDDGPGNYAYPTSSSFRPGAYDLEAFEVYDAGDRIVFRVRTRDLTPTFGNPLGAQLVDVYVHIPGAPSTTAPSFGSRNYTIDPSGAWSRLIEVQGFGQRYVDQSNQGTLGQVDISGNEVSRYITFSVTKATLGTPASGWGFTVVLAGQDGFSGDQVRGFQPTPQEFQFGVCAAASGDPHCTFNPGAVPKALDVFTTPAFPQSAELDYTLGPVVLHPVVMP
jgi:glucoamylase